ncbi:hypothetical protein [Bradyrhizobium sp. URHD0069]|uniref:hypothetical protein n=1 Tax=Bradyrhizobium sp. URHD0069 TaxID=1380355 RepID=UPI0012DE9077|nr:hypothetical protein [Bradyrhizobium sp. URHD0069]
MNMIRAPLKANTMLTTANPFNSPLGVTQLHLSNEAIGSRGVHPHCEQTYISLIEPRAQLLHRLCETLR